MKKSIKSKSKSKIKTFVICLILFIIFIYFKNILKDTPNKEIEKNTNQKVGVVENWPEIKIDKLEDNSSKYLDIKAEFPVSGIGSLSVKNEIQNIVKQFKIDNDFSNKKEDEIVFLGLDKDNRYTLDITYENNTSEKYITHRLNQYVFTGGAHGSIVVKTYTYDKNGKRYLLQDLFINENSLEKLSDFLKVKILENKDYKNNIEEDWLSDGASPKIENFEAFIIDGENIIFIFQQYQIGPYVLGIIEIKIPIKELVEILKF